MAAQSVGAVEPPATQGQSPPVAPGAPAAPGTSAAPVAQPKSHLDRATELILEQRLSEGCVELEKAYDETHEPMLLLRVGRLRQRIGEKDAAKAAYKRYLAEAATPHPGLKAEAEDALRMLDPPPPPLPPPPLVETPLPLPPPPLFEQAALSPSGEPLVKGPPRRNKRWIKIGSLLFAAGYLPALVIPLALSGSLDEENAPSRAANYTVLIPLAGPFVSGIVAPITNTNGHRGQVFSSWSAPWMLTSGLLQVTGFTLLVFGSLKR